MSYLYKNLSKLFLLEYKNAFGNTDQTVDSIDSCFDNIALKYGIDCIGDLDNRLFGKNDNNYLEIRGEKLYREKEFLLPKFLKGRHSPVSDMDFLELGLRFIELYDFQDRDYKRDIYPIMVLCACLHSSSFFSGLSISYQYGMFTVSFISSELFNKKDLLLILENNIEFMFFKELGLINLDDVLLSLKESHFLDDTNGRFHTIIKTLDKDVQSVCLDAVRYWLSSMGELNRQDLEDLTDGKYSARSINDALHKLISNHEVEPIGNIYSQHVKYKYIGKETLYFD